MAASSLSLKACCPLAVNTWPPTHLMPGPWLALGIKAGGSAGVVAGVGSRTLLADGKCLGGGWGVVKVIGVLLAGVGVVWRQEV